MAAALQAGNHKDHKVAVPAARMDKDMDTAALQAEEAAAHIESAHLVTEAEEAAAHIAKKAEAAQAVLFLGQTIRAAFRKRRDPMSKLQCPVSFYFVELRAYSSSLHLETHPNGTFIADLCDRYFFSEPFFVGA